MGVEEDVRGSAGRIVDRHTRDDHEGRRSRQVNPDIDPHLRLTRSCDGYGEHRREHNDDRDDRPPSHIASLFVGSDMGVNVARHAGSPAPEQQRALS